MIFRCDSCFEERNFETQYGIGVICSDGKIYKRICRICRAPRVYVPDVYWDGKPEENLANDSITGQPRVFSCKSEKAAYLKERGLMEAGDKVHGAPVQLHQNQNRKQDTRPQVQEALRKVMQMSPDYRHQEYLRIMKNNES